MARWLCHQASSRKIQAKLVHDLDTGMYSEPSQAKVAKYLSDWLAAKPNLAQTTREGYQRELKRIIRHLGGHKLKDLTPGTVKGFYRDLTAAGYAPKTVRNTAGVLPKALADAVGDGALPRNPADRLELPQSERPETPTYSAHELEGSSPRSNRIASTPPGWSSAPPGCVAASYWVSGGEASTLKQGRWSHLTQHVHEMDEAARSGGWSTSADPTPSRKAHLGNPGPLIRQDPSQGRPGAARPLLDHPRYSHVVDGMDREAAEIVAAMIKDSG